MIKQLGHKKGKQIIVLYDVTSYAKETFSKEALKPF